MPKRVDVRHEFELGETPGHLIRRAQQIHAAVFAETVSDPDLTSPQFAVLAALHQSPDIDQVSLAQRLAIDRSTITDVTARLVERKLTSGIATSATDAATCCS